jgi:archaeal type IV pilus assembly protein PilA
MIMKQTREDAVSPVVGVMLMLVVTIIIAAVVSAFAGGVTAGSDKAPNSVVKAGYSQTSGFWMENTGPDDLSTASTTVYVRCSDSFGNAEHMVWALNKTTISDKDTAGLTGSALNSSYWIRPEGYTGVKSFKVGERHYVLPPYQGYTYFQPTAGSSYRFSDPANLGNSFWVELTDKNGKIFAKTKVKIEP